MSTEASGGTATAKRRKRKTPDTEEKELARMVRAVVVETQHESTEATARMFAEMQRSTADANTRMFAEMQRSTAEANTRMFAEMQRSTAGMFANFQGTAEKFTSALAQMCETQNAMMATLTSLPSLANGQGGECRDRGAAALQVPRRLAIEGDEVDMRVKHFVETHAQMQRMLQAAFSFDTTLGFAPALPAVMSNGDLVMVVHIKWFAAVTAATSRQRMAHTGCKTMLQQFSDQGATTASTSIGKVLAEMKRSAGAWLPAKHDEVNNNWAYMPFSLMERAWRLFPVIRRPFLLPSDIFNSDSDDSKHTKHTIVAKGDASSALPSFTGGPMTKMAVGVEAWTDVLKHTLHPMREMIRILHGAEGLPADETTPFHVGPGMVPNTRAPVRTRSEVLSSLRRGVVASAPATRSRHGFPTLPPPPRLPRLPPPPPTAQLPPLPPTAQPLEEEAQSDDVDFALLQTFLDHDDANR